ncbi:MAG: DNA circularization N-terminal domain-containing protein [Candidatus Aminicenantes bacterium]|jgi:hypothetical protein
MAITLAEIELTGIQNIKTDETRSLVKHRIPGLEGDLIQDLGRKPTTVSFEGIFKGEEALDHIETLRQKFKDREPAAFVSDITDSTDVTEVVIENFMVYQVGGKPDYYTYSISLKEYVEIEEEDVNREIEEQQQQEAEAAQQRQEDAVDNGTMIVETRLELEEGQTDYSGISVDVYDKDGNMVETITQQTDGVFRSSELPAGQYRISVNRE